MMVSTRILPSGRPRGPEHVHAAGDAAESPFSQPTEFPTDAIVPVCSGGVCAAPGSLPEGWASEEGTRAAPSGCSSPARTDCWGELGKLQREGGTVAVTAPSPAPAGEPTGWRSVWRMPTLCRPDRAAWSALP